MGDAAVFIQVLKSRHDARQVGDLVWPMQQVKVEMVCPKARDTPLASPFNSVPCYIKDGHTLETRNTCSRRPAITRPINFSASPFP